MAIQRQFGTLYGSQVRATPIRRAQSNQIASPPGRAGDGPGRCAAVNRAGYFERCAQMVVPRNLANRFYEVGVLLSSLRALSDARRGIQNLETKYSGESSLFSDWKVEYVGVCSLLRAAVHLIGEDAKACHNDKVTQELRAEWDAIKQNSSDHTIYWEFVNKERNSILKEYHWSSYEQYFDENGEPIKMTNYSLISMYMVSETSRLIVKGGVYRGRDTLELLNEAADWVEERVSSALLRAGYQLKDRVHFQTWAKETDGDQKTGTLLGVAPNND